MYNLKYLGLFLSLLSITTMNAQSLTDHQWENRIIILLIDDVDSALYQEQVEQFKAVAKQMTERKLIVYHVTPKMYQTGIQTLTTPQSTQLYQQYKKSDASFEVLLIGLDGGIKFQRNTLLPCTELFAIIDVMPMRKAELKRNKSDF